MDLKGILAISGHAGLFKHVSKTRTGIIVESLTTKKRMHAFTSAKISALQDIAVYTTGEDKPLIEIFQAIYSKTEGKNTLDSKATNEELKKFLEEILPEYDKERVYVSDIKRIAVWYNSLNELGLIDMESPVVEEKESDNKEDGSNTEIENNAKEEVLQED